MPLRLRVRRKHPPAGGGASTGFVHGQAFALSGSGFGSKSVGPAPAMWDDCSTGVDPSTRWDYVGPFTSSSDYNLTYRAQMRAVAPPHARRTSYLCGCAYPGGDANNGNQTCVVKWRTVSEPSYSYASWYTRADSSWVFNGSGGVGGADDNFKTTNWAVGQTAYGSTFWYTNFQYYLSSTDTASELNTSLLPGGSPLSGNMPASSPFQNWHKWEYEAKWSTASSGVYRLWINGTLVLNSTTQTDYSDTNANRSEMIGGYQRQFYANDTANIGTDQWRYFNDIYLDYSWARVMLGNSTSLTGSTQREPQIITAWSDTGITFTVNAGAFADGSTAYLHVVLEDGSVINNVRSVVVGG